MAEYSSAYTQNTTNITNGSETYKFSRSVSVINSNSMDNSCIYCGAENGTVYDYYPTYEISSDPAKKAAIDSLWTFGGGNFTYTASLKNTDYNICFAYIADTGVLNEVGLETVYQIGKQIYNKANPESASNIYVLNPTDIRKIIFVPSFNGYASGSPDAQLVNKDIKYLIDHPDDFWVTSINMTSIMWDGTEYSTPSTEAQKIRPCIVGKDYFLPVCNIFPTHHFDTTDYNSQKMFSQSYYGVYDNDGMPMSFSPIQVNEALTYDTDSSYGGSKTPNNDKYYYNYNYYTSKVQLIAPARQILKLLAYCGCYFADNNYNITGKTLNTMWNDDHIYLGEMKEGARTTGNLIKGTDLLTSDTINKGEYSSQTDFDPSGGGGGGGSFDSDPSAYNDAYTTGVPSSQLYAMTLAQVNDMFDKLTNGGIIPANFEPGNAVISIQRYPFSLSSFASAVAGNITWTARPDVIGPETPTRIMFPPTGEEITGYPIYNPVKRVSLGSFKLSEFWTNYIAFLNREISASLYIPFCGIIEIDINAILNKTITVYLTIDVISGGCTAAVDIDGCMYTTVSGSCSADMYFSTSNYGTIRAALRSNTAEQVYNVAQLAAGAIGAAASGNWAGWGTQAATGAGFNILGKAIKRTMMRNGVTPSVRGTAGDMSSWKLPMHCQLILSLPRPNHSSDTIYGHSHGYLTVTEKTVGSCSGLTVCDNPDVSNISTATDTEKEMIYNMLQNGVYV